MADVQLDDDMTIVTCEVESLYTSIQHLDGLEATLFFLLPFDSDPESGKFILHIFLICAYS